MIKKKSKLLEIEKKYCSCLIKVRSNLLDKMSNKIINPYGICTKSVYGSKNKKRDKVIRCLNNYDFNKMTRNQLKGYALEKKIRFKSKKDLIKKFKNIKKLKNK